MGIDADRLKAVRREALGDEAPTLVFGGEKFDLPLEMPLTFTDEIAAMAKLSDSKFKSEDEKGAKFSDAIKKAFKMLLGPKDFERFMDLRPSVQDLNAIIDALPGEYGFGEDGQGNSSPSES